MRAAISSPLVVGDRSLGAVKVYADEPDAFDGHSEQLLTLFSAQAAVLVANVQSSERAKRLSEGMRAGRARPRHHQHGQGRADGAARGWTRRRRSAC